MQEMPDGLLRGVVRLGLRHVVRGAVKVLEGGQGRPAVAVDDAERRPVEGHGRDVREREAVRCRAAMNRQLNRLIHEAAELLQVLFVLVLPIRIRKIMMAEVGIRRLQLGRADEHRVELPLGRGVVRGVLDDLVQVLAVVGVSGVEELGEAAQALLVVLLALEVIGREIALVVAGDLQITHIIGMMRPMQQVVHAEQRDFLPRDWVDDVMDAVLEHDLMSLRHSGLGIDGICLRCSAGESRCAEQRAQDRHHNQPCLLHFNSVLAVMQSKCIVANLQPLCLRNTAISPNGGNGAKNGGGSARRAGRSTRCDTPKHDPNRISENMGCGRHGCRKSAGPR